MNGFRIEDKIYRLSNQILNMQYCVNKKVVRFWKAEILNWNESEKLKEDFWRDKNKIGLCISR